jgi:2-methylcitrate dehydratase PrpD
MSGQTPDGPSLTERLAQHLLQPVDDDSLVRARLHLLDWLGCVVGGRSRLIKVKDPVPPLERAPFYAAHLEMDDVHRAALLHPGPVVWSALFAHPARDHRLAAMLAAAVRGYEAMIAVGETLDAYHYAHWHPTATAGVFGAVAAIVLASEQPRIPYGRPALQLQLEAAFGHAGSVAGGLWRTRHEPGADSKNFHVAHAVKTAAFACTMAKQVSFGPRFILEGEQGLYAAMCREPRPDRLVPFGETWRIHATSFKPWPACRHAHPVIDAVLMLVERGALAAEGPEIRVETYRDAIRFCDRPSPRSDFEARFSIQHAVAIALVRGAAMTPDDFNPVEQADLDRPELVRARKRVRLVEAPAFSAAYPAHFGARVSVAGETAEVADAWGDPERPMDTQAIETKARMLFDYGDLRERDAEQAIELALRLPLDASDFGGLELRQMVERWLA